MSRILSFGITTQLPIVYLLSEFLTRKIEDYQPPQLRRKALIHGHCHHKAIVKMDDEEAVLRKLGLDIETPDSGCCGMAGALQPSVRGFLAKIEATA